MAVKEKTVIAKLTRGEHTRLKQICLKQKPPVKQQDFVRDLIMRAIGGVS